VLDFEKGDAFHKAKGLALMADVTKKLPVAIAACKAIAVDVARLEKMADAFANPASFIAHVEKDLIVNGKDIYAEIKDSVKQFKTAQYENFGKDIGMALAKVILGAENPVKDVTPLQEAEQIMHGILVGALHVEVPHLSDCITDAEGIAKESYEAVVDYEKGDAFHKAKALALMADVTKKIPVAIAACKAVGVDVTKLMQMAEVFAHPSTFIAHVGKDLIVNGKDIFAEIEDSVKQFKSAQYEKFGEDIGMALAKVIVGAEEPADYFLY
jgi:putative cell wall-binding protein